MSLKVVCLLLAALALVRDAPADQRSWAWTYGSAMLAPGEAELEHYLTLQSPDWSRRETNLKAVHQVELEIGMSERLDAAVYQVFSRSPQETLDWEGFKLRLRYRLTREADAFGHPVLYLEHANNGSLSASVWEAKLLLAQRFGLVDVAVNPVVELNRDKAEFEALAGFSVKVAPLLRVGGELRASEESLFLGPVLSHGGDGLWAALGAGWRLGVADPGELTHELRLVLGVRVKDS